MTDITNLPVLPASQNSIALVIVTTPDGRGGSNPPMQANLAIATGGATGAQGIQGVQGAQGTAGLAGLTGPAGIAGAIGLTGASSIVPGPPGATGPIGSTGATGAASAVAGPAGATGSVGPAGVPGPSGATGPASTVQGPQGPIGNMGGTGPAGAASTVPGPAGATGTAGTAGATGLTGAPGTAGTAGAPGPAGAASTVAGPVGPAGITGPAGTTGATGLTGAASTVAGPAGSAGAAGTAGATGPIGPVGPTGATGPVGPSSGSITPVTTVYTAAGAIALTDTFALVNSAAAVTMTLANGTVDGANLAVKRFGAGVVKVNASLDGSPQAATLGAVGPSVQDYVKLSWSAALATWLIISATGSVTVQSTLIPSARYWRITITTNQAMLTATTDYTGLNAIQMLAAGTNQSTVDASFTVNNSYNGQTLASGTQDWISAASNSFPLVATYDFGAAKQIDHISFVSAKTNPLSRAPIGFRIETSTDNVTFTVQKTYTAATWTAQGQVQNFSTT